MAQTNEFRLRCNQIVPRTSTALFNIAEMWQLGSVFDAFAPPAHMPSPHALPVLVPVVDDPALELSLATRALAGAEDLLGADSEWSGCVDQDDLRAVVEDMRAMRDRHVQEIERAEEDMRVDAAVVLKTMSELGSATMATLVERPHAAKRRRIGPVDALADSQPTSDTVTETYAPQRRARRRQLSPGQKRTNHIAAEQHRRARIRAGCDALCRVVPVLKVLEYKPEELVVAETIAHVKRMQLNQAALLRRLDDVRRARPHVPPSERTDAAPWERIWDGGTEKLEEDTPLDDQEDEE